VEVSLHESTVSRLCNNEPRTGAVGVSEDKIQHTDALELCNQLTHLNQRISSLQHELVLHYCATGVPSGKTKGSANSLERRMEMVSEQLDTIRAELDDLDR